MKNVLLLILGVFIAVTGFGQTAFQFTGDDCNGNAVDLFADLDDGKAVVLLFYMPDCGACPPPAQEIQDMAYNVMNDFPEMVKGYTFPYLNTYSCETVINWIDESHVPFFAPMDSGEYQVAYYGGFGMPTVVLLGGEDHRVLFSTLGYLTSDTTIMRDSILRLFGVDTDILEFDGVISNMRIYPNPAQHNITLEIESDEATTFSIEILDIMGKSVIRDVNHRFNVGTNSVQLDVSYLNPGLYNVFVHGPNGKGNQTLLITK